MRKKWRSIKPLHRGIFISVLAALFVAAAGCLKGEPEDPDYPGVASSPTLRRVVTSDGTLKMVTPRHWDLEKAESPAVLRAVSDGAELVIEAREAVVESPGAIDRELEPAAAAWRGRGYAPDRQLRKAVSAGGASFYYRRGTKPGETSPSLIFGLLFPAGGQKHYYLYSTGFPHSDKLGSETLSVVRSMRPAQ